MKALALGLLLLGPLPAGPAEKAQVPAEGPAGRVCRGDRDAGRQMDGRL